MDQVRRWLTVAGMACVFGFSGWACSHGLRGHESEADALSWMAFTVMAGIAGAFLVWLVVESARGRL